MKLFTPITSGTYVAELSSDFLSALADRVRSGLFPIAAASRNAYEVVSQDQQALRFRSTNLWTGINVGLNDVTVSLDDSGQVKYTIKYWSWTKYAVALCMTLFLIAVLSLTVGRAVLPAAWFVEFDNAPWFGISMLVFWGLLWPWILTAMHKKHARGCLEDILNDVNASDTPQAGDD